MKIGPLDVQFHRTVRVLDGRAPANLPPSLGKAKLTPVSAYREQCPASWESDGFFIPLHDTEALWISFSAQRPVAIMVGAGGVNALTGEKLGIALAAGNYMVAPPQPWIDGWKSDDGSVYQFVATPFKSGDGMSVGEQILGAESVSGGIGIAVFDSKEPFKATSGFGTGYGGSAYGDIATLDCAGDYAPKSAMLSASPTRSASVTRGMSFSEMGVGKGGKISQKIYADPHGIEVWNEAPSGTMAIYLVDAKAYEAIIGDAVPLPVGQEEYSGAWYGQADEGAKDVPGAGVFSGLKSVFPAAPVADSKIEE